MRPSPYTKNNNPTILYRKSAIPVHQNRLYSTFESAVNAPVAEMILAQCPDTGLIYNAAFDASRLSYDDHYDNEQSCSAYFHRHLQEIKKLLHTSDLLHGKVLEIGCGKGTFLDMLLQDGTDITGIDPAYEGHSPRVIRDHYSDQYAHLSADLILLRHTLEHIADPHAFIQMIAKANKGKGMIYIEVPSLEWIYENNAAEDIFYEHCNYFTEKTVSILFEKTKIFRTFGGQYLSVLAELSSFVPNLTPVRETEHFDFLFDRKNEAYSRMVRELDSVAVWGAGAKGATFLFNTDRKRENVIAVVDINEKKQNRFLGGTGHRTISPAQIPEFGIKNIIVMNANYMNEIREIVSDYPVQIHPLQQI